VDRNILLTRKEYIILKTRGHQYGVPAESTQTTSKIAQAIVIPSLMIPCPNTEPKICIPCIPLQQNVNNPHARETHNYNLFNNLTQSLAAMYVLEVLQTCPNQQKSLISALGVVELDDT
jgi:hypothetical protein